MFPILCAPGIVLGQNHLPINNTSLSTQSPFVRVQGIQISHLLKQDTSQLVCLTLSYLQRYVILEEDPVIQSESTGNASGAIRRV